jgi:streptomycin 6-kinase
VIGMPFHPFQPWLARWSLSVDGQPIITRFGSRLIPVSRNGEQAMLKIAGHEEERRGGELMEWYGGLGAARVLAREGDALLLERVVGERSLSAMAQSGHDDEATRILCRTAMALHAPRSQAPPRGLVPLDVWFRALEPATARHGGTFAKAAAAARALLAEPREQVVLHGDFHHDNVLDGGARGWLVIDPKGLLGERGFEYANLFRNPDAATALGDGQMRRRATIVAQEAALDIKRLLRWVLAYGGLGAAWSLESGHDPEPGLAIAERAAAELAR